MKNKLALLLIPFFALASCDKVKVDDQGQTLKKFLSNYSIRISSNSDNLYFSLGSEKSTFSKKGEATLYKPGLFTNSAHYEFGSFNDISKTEFWYYQNSNEENAPKLPITSFKANNGSVEFYYLQMIEFNVKIEEEETHEYDVSIESIEFPEVNVYSLIFAGNVGYQERLSDGKEIGGDEIISHLTSNVTSKATFYMYLNGNDPLVTTENIKYIEDNAKGLFDIHIKVTQVESN